MTQAAHAEQLVEHRGGEGLRDSGLLDSTLVHPQKLAAHCKRDAATLAATYTFGIARNHPFVDGNKRTAAVVSETLLMLNGCTLDATDAEVVVAFVALTAGELTEADLTDCFTAHLRGPPN